MSSPAKAQGVFRYLTIARVTLECKTVLSIGCGESDSVNDVMIIRDVDGLPTIPGTAIAGVLRSMSVNNGLFGQGRPAARKETDTDYDASRIFFSWARVHGKDNKPAKQNFNPSEDEILRWLLEDQPIRRDHVKINEFGTTNKGGKFDRGAVPKGTRFTVEIMIESNDKDGTDLTTVLALIKSPLFRLGGAVHRSYGRVDIVEGGVVSKQFDLADSKDLVVLAAYSPDLSVNASCLTDRPTPTTKTELLWSKTITLTPEGFWRFGGGAVGLRTKRMALDGKYSTDADMLIVTENVIEWNDNNGTQSKLKLLVPGASVKGALAHRIGFHARRFAGVWAGDDNAKEQTAIEKSLFGLPLNDDEGHAGRVMIDDVFIPFKESDIGRISHNKIDQFTGGTINSALFFEEAVWGLPIEFEITVAPERGAENGTEVLTTAQSKALDAALNDLMQGRLSLGANANNGHGYFTGDAT